MVLWIVLASGIIITCNSAGCVSSTLSDFKVILGAGLLELIFEIVGIIKIYKRKQM